MFDLDVLRNDAISELNSEREAGARRAVKGIINAIVLQQGIVAKAKAEITRLQSEMAKVAYEPLTAESLNA